MIWPVDGPDVFTLIMGFVLGAAIGSFLNVCIARLPAGESIVSPPSRCPRCGHSIRPQHNIPIFGFLFLRGRCHDCGEPISWRYPAVEALTGLLFVVVIWRFGLTMQAASSLLFTAALVVVTFIDLDHQIIPDVISIPGILIGLLFAAFGVGPGFLDSLGGALLGAGILLVVAIGYERLRHVEGMGGGDIKLLAMIGAFVGWRNVFVTLLLGSLLGAVVGSIALRRGGGDAQTPIPFGPFLALAAFVAMLCGELLIEWYLALMSA